MSLPKNDIKKKISIVILCAGKGTRLKKITRNLPKPLIRIEVLNNISILHHIINNLIKLGTRQIGIVVGYLGNTIREFISKLERNYPVMQNKLIILDTKNQYKYGSLYSFLSIIKNKDFFTSRNHYLVIPGDTIFDYNILKDVLSITSKKIDLICNHPIVFYRTTGLKPLKERYSKNRIISSAEITKVGSEIVLKKISRLKIKEIRSKDVLNQIIPITALSYESINEMLDLNRESQNTTIWQTLNNMIFNGKKILVFNIENKYDFYDIDYLSDIKKIKKKKRTIGAPINLGVIDSKELKKE
ncbi:MAG: sugar phosphate nucleotidyltransferase [Candidatus Hodarchaeota archaeon]